jgi:hypothetical protein
VDIVPGAPVGLREIHAAKWVTHRERSSTDPDATPRRAEVLSLGVSAAACDSGDAIPPHRPNSLVAGVLTIELAGPQQPRRRAAVKTVRSRALAARSRCRSVSDDDPRDIRLQEPRDRPRVPGHLKRHTVPPQPLARTTRAGRAATRPDLAS